MWSRSANARARLSRLAVERAGGREASSSRTPSVGCVLPPSDLSELLGVLRAMPEERLQHVLAVLLVREVAKRDPKNEPGGKARALFELAQEHGILGDEDDFTLYKAVHSARVRHRVHTLLKQQLHDLA